MLFAVREKRIYCILCRRIDHLRWLWDSGIIAIHRVKEG
jgi:hypothetical protein